MNRIFLPLIILAAALASCSGTSTLRDQVALAETALAEQDVESSRRLCDDILGSKNDKEISAGDYARLSILYMQFYENTDDSEALDQAVDCYRNAIRLNPDSAHAVFDSLSLENHKYAYALSLIVDGLDNPGETAMDHDRYVSPDSIGVISDSIR